MEIPLFTSNDRFECERPVMQQSKNRSAQKSSSLPASRGKKVILWGIGAGAVLTVVYFLDFNLDVHFQAKGRVNGSFRQEMGTNTTEPFGSHQKPP